MKLFFTRQLKKLTNHYEIAAVLIDLDNERKRIKLKANELRSSKKVLSSKLKREAELKLLSRELNQLNIIRGQYLTKDQRDELEGIQVRDRHTIVEIDIELNSKQAAKLDKLMMSRSMEDINIKAFGLYLGYLFFPKDERDVIDRVINK